MKCLGNERGKKCLKERYLLLDLFNITHLIISEVAGGGGGKYTEPSEKYQFLNIAALSEPLQNVQRIGLYFIWKLMFKSNGATEIHSNLSKKRPKDWE